MRMQSLAFWDESFSIARNGSNRDLNTGLSGICAILLKVI